MRSSLFAICLLLLTTIVRSLWISGPVQMIVSQHDMCKNTRKLRNKLAQICHREPAILREINHGISLATVECQHHFKYRHWNCTTNRQSIRRVLMRDTRETSFVNAIVSAGITFAVTRGCTQGSLVQCTCDKPVKVSRTKPKHSDLRHMDPYSEKNWSWGGCGDNVKFGFKKSKEFLDTRLKRKSDTKTLVKLHNYNAGRLMVKNYMRTECKCHGLSASCTVRTCWRKMPTFREIGQRLKEHFDGAAKVVTANDGRSFLPEDETIKTPGREDLLYSEDSPDFCAANKKTGSLGTKGRECNSTSQGVDGCNLLCCSRGHYSKQVRETYNCNCTFNWCCEVVCAKCSKYVTKNYCL